MLSSNVSITVKSLVLSSGRLMSNLFGISMPIETKNKYLPTSVCNVSSKTNDFQLEISPACVHTDSRCSNSDQSMYIHVKALQAKSQTFSMSK